MKTMFNSMLIGLALAVGVTSLNAQNTNVTYQGRVRSGGSDFTGTGQFKFALVTGVDANAQATATAVTSGGFVTIINVTFGGSGYLTAPAVTIIGGGGSGATATASISGGSVTSITVNNPGSGYGSTPTVTIAAPPENISYTTYWSNDGTSSAGSEPATAVSTPVSNGLFTVRWGDAAIANMTALPAGLFQQANLQLRIWFNDGVNGSAVLNPVQRLTATPYALVAGSASNLLGTVSTANVSGTYGNAVTFNNAGNSFSGSHSGSGAGLTSVNAATLGGLSSANFWRTDGNAGANPTNGAFLGTTDNQPLEFKVNGQRALRIEYATNSFFEYSPNMVGGFLNNIVSNGVVGAVIGGGGFWDSPNRVGDDFATVVGGFGNTASGVASTAMGAGTTASGASSTAIGNSTTASGNFSTAMGYGTIASGFYSTAMGESTTASGGNSTAMGRSTTASDFFSTAMGYRAKANHQAALVWGDFANADIASTNANSVTMRAAGGYRLFSDSAATLGVFLAAGGNSWTTISDRNAKKNFQPVNATDVLEKLVHVPIQRWNYKSEMDGSVPHLGPMAQEFKAAFYPGRDDKSISTLEFDGVALAAIQGLNEKVEVRSQRSEDRSRKLEEKLQQKETEIAELKQRLDALEKIIRNQKSN